MGLLEVNTLEESFASSSLSMPFKEQYDENSVESLFFCSSTNVYRKINKLSTKFPSFNH